MKPISDIARQAGLADSDIVQYGPGLAKLSLPAVERLAANSSKGKLVLVTAMTPTKYGEGKTTTTIGLTQGLALRKQRVMAALREPSLGPVFGAKGGGTGGGRATIEPSTRINLHCTGDLHAISAANNLLAALVDNAIYFDSLSNGRRFKQVLWRRCIDMNDRFLRNTVTGLGGASHGVPRETGFDITAASEVMATLCLATSLRDLQARLGRLIVGIDTQSKPITAGDLDAEGAMSALLVDALLPNLAQTAEGVPALVHGGPFANIAHGCNSVLATRSALALSDIAVTEAGFAFDLGGEKFLNLKCRANGLWPAAVVLVVTVRSLRYHGGDEAGDACLERGFDNVKRHVKSLTAFGLTPLISLNVFDSDTESELQWVETLSRREQLVIARNAGYLQGGEGSLALADAVLETLKTSSPAPQFVYQLDDPFEQKVTALARAVYGATRVELTAEAQKDLKRLTEWGLEKLPVCMAKTHLSLSDDPARRGAPDDFVVTIRQLKVSAGAGFLLALTGDILTMPGLPKVPAAAKLSVDADGLVQGVH